jgi:hypothetical protein
VQCAELERTRTKLRQANKRIQQLEQQIGAQFLVGLHTTGDDGSDDDYDEYDTKPNSNMDNQVHTHTHTSHSVYSKL